MRVLVPFRRDEQRRVSAADVDDPVKYPLPTVAGDRHTSLFPDPAVATVERRRFRNDGFVQHQDDSALAPRQPAF